MPKSESSSEADAELPQQGVHPVKTSSKVNPFSDEVDEQNGHSLSKGSQPKSKRQKTTANVDSSDEEQPLFKLPKCPICLGSLNAPVVDTHCCQNQICEVCVLSCVNAGLDLSEGPKCPVCRHKPFGYSHSAVFNRLLGQQEIPCENVGCKKIVAKSDMKLHIDKHCKYTVVSCAQQVFGCPWTGYRREQSKHAEVCYHVENHKVLSAYKEQEAQMQARLNAMQDQCSATEARIDRAVQKFKGEVDKRITELRNIQQTHIDNLTQGQLLIPKPAERPLQVRCVDSRYSSKTTMMMRLAVEIQDTDCVISILSKNVKLNYPFWIAGYIVCLNKGMSALQAAQQFVYRFGCSTDSVKIITVPKSALELGIGESGKMQMEPIALQILVSAYAN
jgi:hypothetical protein